MIARIINLPSSTQRKHDMIKKLSSHPYINYEFIEGVDGRKLTENELQNLFDKEKFTKLFHREVRPGEIGCTLSHRKIWKEALSKSQITLVLEDDLVIKSDISEQLKWAENYLDSDKPRIVYLSDRFLFFKKKSVAGTNFNIVKPFQTEVTTCYAINPAAAESLLKEKPYYVADAWNLHSQHAEIKAVYPSPTSHEPEETCHSTIFNPNETSRKFSLFERGKLLLLHILKTLLLKLKIIHES